LKLQKVQKVKRAMMKNGSHMSVFAVKAKEPLPKAKMWSLIQFFIIYSELAWSKFNHGSCERDMVSHKG
jgi:hypothetical protein